MRYRFAGTALAAVLFLSSCDSGSLSEEEACRMAIEYLMESRDGWQFHDAYHYPMVAYKNIEVQGCFDFQSDNERGYAKITVRAIGDEYVAEVGTPRGRKELTPSFEFDRFDQGWKIVE
jgi:hypothetical protein